MQRKILLHTMDLFLDALIRGDSSLLPLAEVYKATFNGKEAPIGENTIWRDTLTIPQRQTFADTVSNQVVFYGIVTNEATKRMPDKKANGIFSLIYPYVVRIHVNENEKIDEIEEVYVEKENCGFKSKFEDIRLPELLMEMPVAQEERCTREELIEMTGQYWDAIERSMDIEDLPSHPDTTRRENGWLCTDAYTSFRNEFREPTWTWFTPKEERRFPVVDPIRGIVVSFQVFISKDDEAIKQRSDSDTPGFLVIEVFKADSGLLRHMYAFWRQFVTDSGWR